MSVPSWCRVGTKVVYVGHPSGLTNADLGFKTETVLAKGPIYTIRSVLDGGGPGPSNDRVHLRVKEMRLRGLWPDGRRYTDAWTSYRCFIPLVDDANDSEVEAEIYRKKVHQNGAPVKALERT